MSTINKQSINFENGIEAIAVFPTATDSVESIVSALAIPSYQAVVLILGGADSLDENLNPRLAQLFSRSVPKATADANAVIMDGGTQSGVMSMIGKGVADGGYRTPIIGVAPVDKVSYPGIDSTNEVQLEPNHSHFVLVEAKDWGGETATMFKIANFLISKNKTNDSTGQKPWVQDLNKTVNKAPALAVLAGGGPITKKEILFAVRQNFPVIVVEGSGGLADQIALATNKYPELPSDPELAEIVADGEIHIHHIDNSAKAIERLISRELSIDKVLMQAWETFADYDLNANLQQKRFDRIQLAIIVLGVFGIALVVIQQVYGPRDAENKDLLPVTDLLVKEFIGWWVVYHLLIIMPILLTVLVTATSRFKQGSKWLLLRAGAEAIKREIYRYRTRAMYYKNGAEQQLAQRIEAITQRTMRTEVNLSALQPYNKEAGFPPYMFAAKGGDDGFSSLTPDRYVEVRLGDQLNFFKKRAVKLDNQLNMLYWLTFIIGGVGTYLAAVGMQAWIALTTSLVAAIGTYLGYRQTENTLTKYNQAATNLSNVRAWWDALPAHAQANQVNIDSLVEHTEQVLQFELDGWIQQMQNALAELRKGQGITDEKEEKNEPQEPPNMSKPKPDSANPEVDGKPENGQTTGNSSTHSNTNEGQADEIGDRTGTALPVG